MPPESQRGTSMSIAERILLFISRVPEAGDYVQECGRPDIDHALDLLVRVCPTFVDLISGKRVADFGCGFGYQSIALAKMHGCTVVGIDSNRNTLDTAIENAKVYRIPSSSLSFAERASSDMLGSFDFVISQNSFEHLPNPGQALDEMTSLLKGTGKVLITFGPPWLAPYGSHMHFFCKVPWINVLFSEKTVMKARSHFRSDGARKYEEVESGLNRMTVAKFESILSSRKLRVVYRKYDCVRQINVLSKVPLLREFFVNHVTAILANEKG